MIYNKDAPDIQSDQSCWINTIEIIRNNGVAILMAKYRLAGAAWIDQSVGFLFSITDIVDIGFCGFYILFISTFVYYVNTDLILKSVKPAELLTSRVDTLTVNRSIDWNH